MPESHHYLPRMYLREFVDPETPNRQSAFVWVLDREREEWKKRAPKNVAKAQDFYAFVDEAGETRQDFEKQYLSQLEGQVARIVRNKVLRRRALDASERQPFAEFVACMMCRVPSFRDTIDAIVGSISKMSLQLLAHNEQARQHSKAVYERETGLAFPTLDELVQGSQSDNQATREFHLNMMVEWIRITTNVLLEMDWTFLTPPSEGYWFITSDNPVSLCHPELPDYGLGLGYSGIHLVFPITPGNCLLAAWRRSMNHYSPISAEMVGAINLLTVDKCEEMIFSPKGHFPGLELALDVCDQ